MSSPNDNVLDYAEPPARPHKKLIAWVIVFMLAGVLTYAVWRRYAPRVDVLRNQAEVLTAVQSLAATPERYHSGSPFTTGWAIFLGDEGNGFRSFDGLHSGKSIPTTFAVADDSSPIERNAGNGPRIVYVYLTDITASSHVPGTVGIHVTVGSKATFFSDETFLATNDWTSPLIPGDWTGHAHPPLADTKDAAKFTLLIHLDDGTERRIIGTLRADDSVSFEMLDSGRWLPTESAPRTSNDVE